MRNIQTKYNHTFSKSLEPEQNLNKKWHLKNSKLIFIIYKMNCTLWPRVIYFRYACLVQHSKINQCNLYQAKEEKSYDHIN